MRDQSVMSRAKKIIERNAPPPPPVTFEYEVMPLQATMIVTMGAESAQDVISLTVNKGDDVGEKLRQAKDDRKRRQTERQAK